MRLAMKLELTATESLLVVAQNRIDLLTGEKIAALREEVEELQRAIEAVKAREAKYQRASIQAWDQTLSSIGKAHGVEIPASARMEADDADLVSITWDDPAPELDDDQADAGAIDALFEPDVDAELVGRNGDQPTIVDEAAEVVPRDEAGEPALMIHGRV